MEQGRWAKVVSSLGILGILLAGAAGAEEEVESASCGNDPTWYRHLTLSEPQPPVGAYRRDNITDEEVREVQAVALEVYPHSIVSISGVTEGCGCEDGPACTAQVWLSLNGQNQVRSLVLSKVSDHWKVSAVENWWLRYHDLLENRPKTALQPQYVDWKKKEEDLEAEFPTCPVPARAWRELNRTSAVILSCSDLSSFKVSQSVRTMRVKHISYPGGRLPIHPVRSYSIDLMDFDCRERRTRFDAQEIYYTDGRVRTVPAGNSLLWDPIKPGTQFATELDLICKMPER